MLLNSSSTAFHPDISSHPIFVNNPSKEENDHRHTSQCEDNAQETQTHSISHSSDVTFVSQLSYVSLFHYNFSIISLPRTSRLFYFKYLLDRWQGYLFSNNFQYYLDSFQSPFFIITILQRTLLLLVHIFRVIESNILYTNLPQVIILSTNWGIWLSIESILLISICVIWISGLPVSISSPSCLFI